MTSKLVIISIHIICYYNYSKFSSIFLQVFFLILLYISGTYSQSANVNLVPYSGLEPIKRFTMNPNECKNLEYAKGTWADFTIPGSPPPWGAIVTTFSGPNCSGKTITERANVPMKMPTYFDSKSFKYVGPRPNN